MNILSYFFPNKTELDTDDGLNPWAGLASYEDPATTERKLKFCGRDDDSYDVAKLIMGNIFVTLYGKSGIGKTSLLNAGVFPELREEQFTPISLRLGMRDDDNPQSYQKIIIEAVKRVVHRIEVIDVIPTQDDQQSVDYLWKYFASHRFYDKDDTPTIPVVVFDQFEEVFRNNREEAETLLRQLDNCAVNGSSHRYEINIRFVISIREDDLYRFEDSIDNCYLPSLKRCRYRLRSLSEQGARDAILIPGEGLFREDEKDQIAQTIIGIARNKEDNSISTNLLSLVCNRLYVESQKSGVSTISLPLVDSFVKDNPFERFYNEATRGFSNKEKSYIEDNFVDSTGRRNSIPESNFLVHVKDGKKLIDGTNRILQRVNTSSDGGNFRIELIHDSFCEPLFFLKEKREKRKRLEWLIGVASIALLCIGITGYILYQMNKISSQEGIISEQKKLLVAKNDYLENALKDANRERLAAQKARKDAENATQEKLNTIFELEEKNKALAQLNAQLEYEKENVRIEKERADLAVIEANKNIIRLRMELANQCLEDGDSYTARLLALEALTNENNPYMPEAEAMLRKASVENGAVLHAFFSTPCESKFTADGNYIISSGETLKVWDANNGALIKTIPNMYYNPISIRKQEVLVAADSTIFKFDKDWNLIPVHKYNRKISFFPENSNNYVSLEGLKKAFVDGNIRWIRNDSIAVVIESESGDSLMALVHDKRINSVNYSHNGNLIVTASEDNSVKIWDAKTGVLQNTLLGHLPTPPPYTSSVYSADNGVMYALFNSNDSLVFSCSRDKTIRLWSVASGECVDTIFFKSPINFFALDRDDSYIWAACEDGNIYGYNILTQEMGRTLKGHSSDVINICYSPNYRRLVSIGNDGAIRIWDGKFRDLEKKMLGHTDFGYTILYSPKGDMIASASRDSTIGLWSKYGYLRKRLVGHTGEVFTAIFSRDGKSVVSASADSTIRIWDVQKRKEVKKLTGHHDWVTSAAFSPNGDYVISNSSDSTIRIWSVLTGGCIDSIRYNQGYDDIDNIKYSADGQFFYVKSKKIYKYDISTKQIVDSIGVDCIDNNGIYCYNFNPDSTLIAYAVLDTISVWSIEQKKVILKWKTRENEAIAHVEFSPDGRYCLSVGLWSPLKIWDVQTGTLIKEYNDNWNSPSASFSPSDDYIVTTGGEPLGKSRSNNTELWKFPKLELLIKQTQDRFGNRQLTPEERRKYYLE